MAPASSHGALKEGEASRLFGLRNSPYMIFGPGNYMGEYEFIFPGMRPTTCVAATHLEVVF